MIAPRQYRSSTLAIAVLLAVLVRSAEAASLMLPSGEPDPKCPGLRLWLRADSGIKDTRGRGPQDPDFNGRVAEWNDRSAQKFRTGAVSARAPLFVESNPAAGNRPAVAFNGEHLLMSSAELFDQPESTVAVVVQGQPRRGGQPFIYSLGKGQGKRQQLGLAFDANSSLRSVAGHFLVTRGERAFQLNLGLPGDGRSEGRFAAIISTGELDRCLLEFHDGLSGLTGGEFNANELTPQQSAADRCHSGFTLGGADESVFCGQIAEMLVFNRALSLAERRELANYLRRRYAFDVTEGLLPAGTFLLGAETFEGNWKCVQTQAPAEAGRYLRSRHMRAEGDAAAEGIKTKITLPSSGKYYVWVRAHEGAPNTKTKDVNSAIRTIIQGKELAVTHLRGVNGIVWREAGEVDLKAGPAEIVVRGEGPGMKECDAVLVGPIAATEEEVEAICALAQRIRCVGGKSRLTAVFENGLRLDGSLLSGWRWLGPGGEVSRPTSHAMSGLVCLQFDRRKVDSDRGPAATTEAMFEFQNGDRLWGTICGYTPASTKKGHETPSQLALRLPKAYSQDPKETFSVETDWLRRIVFEPSMRDRACPPQTLLCRDGRRFVFRAVRWSVDSLTLLTEDGLERVPINQIAELQFASADPWQTYYRELSELDPNGGAAVVRVETADGMILTASTIRSSQRRSKRGPGQPPQPKDRRGDVTQRMMQPAWCGEPIPVRWSDTRLLWQASAHVVPLSRFAPEQAVNRGTLGSSWKWQADRNVAGGDLRCGGLDYLWGFGVHASNEIAFIVPDCVRAFRTSIGIDDVVGDSGCAKAKVYADHAGGAPLYQSKLLVGSGMPVSTGEIVLPPASGRQRRLILVTDSATASAEMLDIGSHVDWLEPVLLLDPDKLRTEVGKLTVPR